MCQKIVFRRLHGKFYSRTCHDHHPCDTGSVVSRILYETNFKIIQFLLDKQKFLTTDIVHLYCSKILHVPIFGIMCGGTDFMQMGLIKTLPSPQACVCNMHSKRISKGWNYTEMVCKRLTFSTRSIFVTPIHLVTLSLCFSMSFCWALNCFRSSSFCYKKITKQRILSKIRINSLSAKKVYSQLLFWLLSLEKLKKRRCEWIAQHIRRSQ